MYERSFDFIKYALDIVLYNFSLLIIHVEVLRYLLPFPIHFCEKFRGFSFFN